MRKPRIDKDKRRGTYRVEWWVAGPDGDEKRQEQCGTDHAFAKELLEVKENLVKRNALGQCDLSRSARDCHDAYISWMEVNNYPPVSIQTSKDSCGYYLKRIGTMADVTVQSLLDWLAHMQSADARTIPPGSTEKQKQHILAKGPLKPNSIRRRLIDVRTWLNWAKASEWLEANPMNKIREERMRAGRRGKFMPPMERRPRFYTKQELRAIEAAIEDKEFLAIVRLGFLAGLREGEIAKVKAEDITFYINLIGEHVGDLRVTSRKGTGEDRTRVVTLNEAIVRVLPKIESGLLFPRWFDESNGTVRYKMVRYHFRRAKERAGIVGVGTFYELRHTFARFFMESNPKKIDELRLNLGHESLEMMKVYASYGQEQLGESIQAMKWGDPQ